MEFTIREIAVIINSLETRLEWAELDDEILDEQPHLKSALKKLKSFEFDIQKREKK